jgi:hypothetical protein
LERLMVLEEQKLCAAEFTTSNVVFNEAGYFRR